MSFKKGDIVQVAKGHWKLGGKIGVVSSVSGAVKDGYFLVSVDDTINVISGKDLTLYDEKHEALIALAETLDSARKQANKIEEAASQRGVYGQIADALEETLKLIFKGHVDDHSLFASLAYSALLDGKTVREAVRAVVRD